MSILEVKNVSKFFGGVKANVDVTMSVEQGSIVGLIGPNGSGKTTLFNSIVGTHPIDSGSIKFNGTEVSQLPVPVVAKLAHNKTETISSSPRRRSLKFRKKNQILKRLKLWNRGKQ